MNFLNVKFKFLFIILLSSKTLLAQNTGVSDVANTPDASAVLDVYSTSKGMLVPRLTQLQRTNITTPATGLLVYQTDGTTPGFYYYTGTTWTPIASGSGSRWSLVPNTNDIYYSSGFVGVGVSNPTRQLVVNNTLEIRRSIVNGAIAELLFTNTSGTGDFRIGSDGGDIFWQGGGGKSLQMGSFHTTVISGDRQVGGFPTTIAGITNQSVLIRSSRDASIPLSIQGNSAGQTANLTEWLNASGNAINVVNSAGNVGIGVTAPIQKLEVEGNFRLNGVFMPNNLPGTNGQVLQSTGNATAPIWTDLSSATSNLSWALGGNNLTGIRNLGTITNIDLPFITNSSEKMRIMAGGNVGIGTTAPTARLDVNGNLRVATLATGLSTDQIVTVGTDGILNQRTSASIAADAGAITTANNGLTKTGNNVQLGGALVQPTSISGITAANALSFTSPTAADAAIIIGSAGTTPNEGGGVLFGNTNHGVQRGFPAIGVGNNVGLFTTNGNLSLSTNGRATGEFTLLDNGNVGIGLTAPTEKLEVNGNIKITGANAGTRRLTFAGTTLGGGAGDPDGIIELRPVNANEQQEMLFYVGNDNTATYGPDRIRMVAEEIRFQNFNNDTNTGSSIANAESQTNVNTRMIITPDGNVGINNATPAERVDVTGNLKLTGAFMPNGLPGTAGFILQSAGANTSPVWTDLSAATSSLNWTLGGNNLTGIRNLGTTSNFDLPFITNNTEKMRISAAGNVGVGATTFGATNPEKFLVNAGTTTSVNAFVARGNINKYFQTNIQNLSTGNQASSDIVATANNGTESTFFVNLGINGSGFVYDPANNLIETGAANDGYLLSAGNNFHIVNSNATRDMIFSTGGTAAANEAMRLTAARNLGIGVTAPTQKLDVAGNFRLTGAFMPNGNAGTAGQVLQSAGVNASPVWVAAGASSGWALGGNSVATTNTLGTTSNFDLPFITNNTERMRISAAGNVGIGVAPTNEKLEVNGNVRITGANAGTRRLSFAGSLKAGSTGTSDPDGIIELRPVTDVNEQQEMLFYMGNDNSTSFGPDRIRMVAEEFRWQTINSDINSNIGNAESQTNVNNRMIISSAGNVGIATTTPNSTLDINGSLSMSVRTVAGATPISETDYIVINTGGTGTWTLPAAAAVNQGRIYRLLNHGTGAITLSQSYTFGNGATTNTISITGGQNAVEIISDGTVWRRINY